MKRILFVDDEPMVLSGLQRSLYGARHEWDMKFVCGGQEALQAMAEKPFDVIVTDMRMPVMDGAQLLEEIRVLYPQCLRFVLSGQADRETVLKTVSPAHQFLAKPCEGTVLRNCLTRALAIQGLLRSSELRGLIAKLESLPSLPALYIQLTNELNKPEASVSRIAQLFSEDMALTAKTLQLVNSAFFGLRTQVSSSTNAVQLLGIDTIRGLVLSTHIFSKFKTDLLSEADVQYLWRHSMHTASAAKMIATSEQQDRQMTDQCFTAGLLHDIGKLILASALKDKYREVLNLVRNSTLSLQVAEMNVLGCGHAEVAAYLLGLWGLPSGVIEAVAWHQCPNENQSPGFSAVLATHFASNFNAQRDPYWLQDGTALDLSYLEISGYAQKQEQWIQLLQNCPFDALSQI
jgi:HD-like signal output (HDOD) protein/ActR/RegA family two-component response regulator